MTIEKVYRWRVERCLGDVDVKVVPGNNLYFCKDGKRYSMEDVFSSEDEAMETLLICIENGDNCILEDFYLESFIRVRKIP